MGADVARNITVLNLEGTDEGALDLPTLTTVALTLAGTLRHVRTLKLSTRPCGANGFRNLYAVHSALRGAFPALEELCLPVSACLRGLEVFAGSALHTVRVLKNSYRVLRLSHVRSLLPLSQLRHLDLAGTCSDDFYDGGDWDDLYESEGADADADDGSPAGVEYLALGDVTLAEKLRQQDEEDGPELCAALRRLLASAPPALESLRLHRLFREVEFVGGRVTRAVMWTTVFDLWRAAAALLPRLEATGQRLPLLEVDTMEGDSDEVFSLLQPHTAFGRLLVKCNRLEVRRLELSVGPSSEHSVALQAVKAVQGGGAGGEGGDSVAAAAGRCGSGGRGTDGAATAAPAAVMELTAEQLLERAADKIWTAASVQGAASMAEAEMGADVAARAADSQERSYTLCFTERERWNVLLRGPFVWQLTCGPGAGDGTRLLTDWLDSLLAARPPPPAAAAQGSGMGAAGATRAKMRRCSFAPCGSGNAMATLTFDYPIEALQLHQAVAESAEAGTTPSCLLVCPFLHRDYWSLAIAEVIQELWDDHVSSAHQPAAAVVRTAAAAPGAGAEADGPADGGGGGGLAKPTPAGAHTREGQGEAAGGEVEAAADGEPGRMQGGQPAGDAVGGGGGDDDLQVLMRLLQLLMQAQVAAVCRPP
ncbi:hypothetical protein HXX76_015016 [Chlamydomonas incerta]|uniref:Uncharacterized protein n=1 Tax=Chlamydomonas incerta TaxID=51695 RepID=A0A835SE38_CHLIN|nr:hypothetical protein HXX76_015016 [Chlamydomonas incerta]|eukprot:KAG2423856.1 hypothetical protein HXX76_015016 [Chlamydomonas incerta]